MGLSGRAFTGLSSEQDGCAVRLEAEYLPTAPRRGFYRVRADKLLQFLKAIGWSEIPPQLLT
jgi:hypothetical protein